MTKRYQRGNEEGTNQRRTDNKMTKKYQRVIKKAQIKEGLTIQ
jgi:hypothetical protein